MSFKYIDSGYVGYTASDADALTELPLGSLLPGYQYLMSFRIGNTGTDTTSYKVTGITANPGAMSGFTIEYQGDNSGYLTMDNGIVVPDIEPNMISEVISISFTADTQDLRMGSGTIRILTEEQ
jgi:hypothetical protein